MDLESITATAATSQLALDCSASDSEFLSDHLSRLTASLH